MKYIDPDGRENGIPSDVQFVLDNQKQGTSNSAPMGGGLPPDVQEELGLLNGNNQSYLDTQESLVGTNYVWGGNNPETDGGVDCSGAVLHGVNQLGNNTPDQTADGIFNNLTRPVTGPAQPGDLRFIDFDNDGVMDHVQTLSGVDGARINPTGGPTNTVSDPGEIVELPGPIPATGEIRRLRFR